MTKDNTAIILILAIVALAFLYNQGYFENFIIVSSSGFDTVKDSYWDTYPYTLNPTPSICSAECASGYYFFDYPAYARGWYCKHPNAGLQCAKLCSILKTWDEVKNPSTGLWEIKPLTYDYQLLTCNYQCFSSTDCGTNVATGSPYCQDGDVYQRILSYTCSSYTCGSNTGSSYVKERCNTGCSNGACKIVIDPSCTTNGAVAQFDGDYYVCKDNKWMGVSYLLSIDSTTINELQTTLDEKARIIEAYSSEIDRQTAIINVLNSTLQEKIIIVNDLMGQIDDLNTFIDHLNENLEDKKILLSQLEATTQRQAELIAEMEEEFSEQEEIIIGLNEIIVSDLVELRNANATLEEMGNYINSLEASIQDQTQAILILNVSLAEEQELVKQLDLTIEQQAQIIEELGKRVNKYQAISDFYDKYKWHLLVTIVIGILLLIGGRRK